MVAALGGNALLQRGEPAEADIQVHHVADAVAALAPLCADHQLVVTHGNGPQVGILASESERDPSLARPYPFDDLVAQTQGMIGYWLVQGLENATDRPVAGLLCQTVVDGDDPAFSRPTKYVGPPFDQQRADELVGTRGWTMQPDGSAWRRVVASPRPLEVVEVPLVRELIVGGWTVVCGGGGGVPVVRDQQGQLRGVEAVVDKDLTSALLAEAIGAELLLLLTDVAAVEIDHGSDRARPLTAATVAEVRGLSFPAGSMGPKVEAACGFAERTGHRAVIGHLDDVEHLVAGAAGTTILP